MQKEFPNGFASWVETHHEIVTLIALALDKNVQGTKQIQTVSETHGTGGLYILAVELTDQFETLNKNRNWDGDFFEEIEQFMKANA